MIVLVEDSDATARIHYAIIRRDRPGMFVQRARSQEELRGLLAFRPLISLVLMDLILIGSNGNSCITLIRSIPMYEDTPIVVLTGSDVEDGKERSLRLGADDYYVKGYDDYSGLVSFILRKWLK